MLLRYISFILLLALASFTSLNAQSCDLLSGNINLGGTAHDPGFQENDDVNTAAILSNGNFVIAWETRDDVDGDRNGAFFQVFTSDGTAVTDVITPYADVNPDGIGRQGAFGPKVVALTTGFVVGWESEDGPGDTGPVGDDQTDVFFRVYNDLGSPVANSVRLSMPSLEDQLEQILPLSTGGFVVLTSIGEDDTDNSDDYFVQAFNASGVATSDPPINISGGAHDAAFQTEDQAQSMVDLGSGNFAVTWESRDDIDGDDNGGFFRIFNADGMAVTGIIRPYEDINPAGTGDQGTPGPKMIKLSNGNLVVAWDSERGPTDIGPGGNQNIDVYFRIYTPTGIPVSGTTKANSDNTADEEKLRGIIALTGGNFAILYNAEEDDTGNNDDFYVRTFTPTGTPVGNSLEVSGGAHVDVFCSTLNPLQSFAALSNGNFVFGWAARDGVDGDEAGVYYRVFNAAGAAVSPLVLPYEDINPGGTGDQSNSGPYVKTLADGFVIAWHSELGPGDVGLGGDQTKDVYHRVIDNTGNPLCGTTKTNAGNDAGEELLEDVQALANGDFVVVYKDDEDDTGNNDDYFLRFIGGAPLQDVCPTVGTLTTSVSAICVNEPFNITVTGLENMAQSANNEQDYGIKLVAFADMTSDPYTGGTLLGTVAFADLTGGATSATLNGVLVSIPDPDLFIYAILDANPSDADCRPAAQVTMAINAFPSVSFSVPAPVCADAGVQTGLSGGSPAGGVYSGPGVTDDGNGMTYTFNPAAAGVGAHPITYSVTVNGCTDSEMQTVVVNAAPEPGFLAPAAVCVNTDVQTGLSGGSPAGGVYSGPGVTDDGNGMTYTFDPAVAGVGAHPITYTVTVNGCTAAATASITVNAAPSITFFAPAAVCVDAGPQTGLGEATPTGGVYSGPGVTDDGNGATYTFDPAVAGVGTHPITYTVTVNGCPAATTVNSTVNALPTVTFTAPDDLLVDAGVQTGLGGGSPAGGVYSGPGVTDDGNGMTYSFDPAAAGVATHTLTYTYTDGNGCTATGTDQVTVSSNELIITPIDDINDLNPDGTGISVGQSVAVQGVVHCVDIFEGVGLQFWIIEPATGDGIGLYSVEDVSGYVVTEGDDVILEGTIAQFAGALEIEPTNITLVSQDNDLVTPIPTNSLAEELESKWVTLQISDVDPANISIVPFNAGLEMQFPSSSQGTIRVRVFNSTGIGAVFLTDYIAVVDVAAYLITGLVVQEDFDAPFDDFYYLYPCSEESFDYLVGTDEPAWANELQVYPNPTTDRLQVNAPVRIEELRLLNLQGSELHRIRVNSVQHSFDMSHLPNGVYQLQLISGKEVVNRPVVKQ